jgi:uncharacterized protein YkwD
VTACAAVALSGVASGRCGSGRAADPPPSAHPAIRHLGPDRNEIAYSEHAPREKALLFRRLNEDRVKAGLKPLAYDSLAAKVGDEFCLESAQSGAIGHWDREGRAPYLRWSLAGGVDYHAQNFASHTSIGAPLRRSVADLLLEGHEGMMAETPPDDGHRRAILDPYWTHVGLGSALVGGEFRMTEEFSRQIAEWVEIPAGPVPARGTAPFGAKLPPIWKAGVVEIAWEAPPAPLSLKQIRARGAYSYPHAIHRFRPTLGAGTTWSDGSHGDFQLGPGGRIELPVPIDHGPGSYYVIVYVGHSLMGEALTPAIAARIEAR